MFGLPSGTVTSVCLNLLEYRVALRIYFQVFEREWEGEKTSLKFTAYNYVVEGLRSDVRIWLPGEVLINSGVVEAQPLQLSSPLGGTFSDGSSCLCFFLSPLFLLWISVNQPFSSPPSSSS